MPHLRKSNILITKRLQTELQALIAFACYNSDEILECGKSSKRQTVVNNMLCLYMPLSNGDDKVSYVEQFLEGLGKFKYLFIEKENTNIVQNIYWLTKNIRAHDK